MAARAVTAIQKELRALGNPEIAAHSAGFFKTGPGEYGEGDKFVGVRVPELRRLAKKHREISLAEAIAVLHSPIHEQRLLALLILVLKYQRGDPRCQKEIYDLYLSNTAFVNNWDLVDSSSHHIVGNYLLERSRRVLYRLAKSRDLWERRIAIISTYAFIKSDDFEDALALSEKLLHDEEDLIHKAVGWMLREVGNRDRGLEEAFLDEHASQMPRTMLRYAIEKFPVAKRKRYLKR